MLEIFKQRKMMQHIHSKAHMGSQTEAISDKHIGQAQPRQKLGKDSTQPSKWLQDALVK